MQSKLNVSLKVRLVSVLLLLVLLSAIGMGFSAYRNASRAITDTVGNTAMSILRSTVSGIDSARFRAIADSGDGYYQELLGQLNQVCQSVGLKYLYTMRQDAAGDYLYVVDGSPEDQSAFSERQDPAEMTPQWVASFAGTAGYELDLESEWGALLSAYVPILDAEGRVVGILGADFDASEVAEQLRGVQRTLVLQTGLIVLAASLLGWAMASLLVRSMRQLQRQADRLRTGDLTVRLSLVNGDAETRSLQAALQSMVESLVAITRSIRSQTEDVLSLVAALGQSARSTRESSSAVAEVAGQVAAGAQEQVQSMESVSVNVANVFTEITRATEQAQAVEQSANSALLDSRIALDSFQDSIDQVRRVNEAIGQTAIMVAGLGDKSQEISSFSQTITQIASQTNLLALNAAIEAARAGEQGKGFAIVAEQVKTLATAVNQASGQIGQLVQSMQSEIGQTTAAIRSGVEQARVTVQASSQVGERIQRLFDSNQIVLQRVEQVLDAVKRIEQDCQLVVERVQVLTRISSESSSGSLQAAAATQEQLAIMQTVEANLQQLQSIAGALKQSVDRFKVD